MTTSSRRKLAALALGLASAFASTQTAGADPSPSDMESAREQFKEARELRAHGDLAGALARFKTANALAGTPITALELGRTYALTGKLVEAREVLLSVRRIPVKPNESEKAAGARQEAEKLAADLEPRIATLTIHVEGVPAGVAATTTLDGAAIPSETLSAPRKVDPGAHVITARTDGGGTETVRVDLREGEARHVSVTVTPATSPSLTAAPATAFEATREPQAARRSGVPPLAVAGFVTAGVGVATGAVFGAIAFAKAGAVKDECQGTACLAGGMDDVRSGRVFGIVSTVGFGVAVAGVALGVVGLAVRPAASREASAQNVVLQVGPGRVAVMRHF